MSFFFLRLVNKKGESLHTASRSNARAPQTSSNHSSWPVYPHGDPRNFDHPFLTSSPSNITPAGPYDAFPSAGPYEECGLATDSASSLFEHLAFPNAAVHGMVQNENPNSRLLQPLSQTFNPGNFPTDDPEPWERILSSDSIAVNGEYLLIPEIGPLGASLSSHDEDMRYTPNRITQHEFPDTIAYPNVTSGYVPHFLTSLKHLDS